MKADASTLGLPFHLKLVSGFKAFFLMRQKWGDMHGAWLKSLEGYFQKGAFLGQNL